MKNTYIVTIVSALLLSINLNAVNAEEAKSADRPAAKKSDRQTDRPSRESIIKRFDKDGDGKLSESERSAARKALGTRSGRGGNSQSQEDQQRQRRARYDAVAKNLREQVKAGKITEEQARERLGQLRKRMAQAGSPNGQSDRGGNSQSQEDQQRQRRARYDAVAKNLREQVKAGKITEEQARERLGQLRKRMAQAGSPNGQSDRSRGSRERLMKEFDKNKDGKLDEKERAALRKAMSERSTRGGREEGERGERRRRGGEGQERSSRGRRGGEGQERSSRGRRSGERGQGGERRRGQK